MDTPELNEASGLPPSVLAAWGRPVPQRKGPQRALSVAQIVDAGVRIADTDGLGAVSMARMAADLGVATMALYRYVGAKDELLELMIDAALGPPEPVTDGWRAGLAQWARTILAVYRRHPWVLQVPITMPPITPNQVALMENCLAALRGTPLTEDEKVSVLLLLSGFVRNNAMLEANIMAAATKSGGSWAARVLANYGSLLRHLTDDERHPNMRATIAAGAFDEPGAPDQDQEFEFGLACILDGIAILIER